MSGAEAASARYTTKIGLGLLADPKHLIASITSIDLIKPLGSASHSHWNELDAIYCRRSCGVAMENELITRHELTNVRPSQKTGMFSTDSNFCFSTWV